MNNQEAMPTRNEKSAFEYMSLFEQGLLSAKDLKQILNDSHTPETDKKAIKEELKRIFDIGMEE